MHARVFESEGRQSSITRMLACWTVAALAAGAWQAAVAASPVADAASTGDLDRVRELISSGDDVNVPQGDGSTALLWAVYESHPEMVAALIDAGADPNAANEFGIAPLLQASRSGDATVVRALLEAGADIAVTSPNGETALMAAARSGSVEAVSLLLKHGSDPNAAESLWEQTALMWAAVEGHAGVVDVLLNAGADPNMQARVSELEKRTTRTDFPSGGFTALMWAARNGDETIVRRLVEGGADIDLTNADGATAMMIALVNDRFDFAAMLLELGADPDDGSLYQAVLMHDATTDWLAKDGTQWRADHPNELTALDLTRVLLDAGADPNKPFVGQLHSTSMCCDTKENATPLFRAAVAADVEALKLLIEHGGDVQWSPEAAEEEPGADGPPGGGNASKTPLMVAMNGGRGVGMAGGPGDIREGRAPPFREEANREPVDAVKLLLEAGADPDALTSDGEAALHMAAKDGKLDIVRVLAEGGATLDIVDGEGKTSLEIVEAMPPREPPPLTGAQAGRPQGAQPAEVAALLRELMGLESAPQANLQEGAQQ
ncbi:ankyrin repeat domain-containing protein [Candidatus Rariloculus sp.]|uniref:ankyrin repeat domain-containing protein n=1 Tax=Candidatus Rariloculus sp. TaxID=3101265 RepID=UPI003D132AA9